MTKDKAKTILDGVCPICGGKLTAVAAHASDDAFDTVANVFLSNGGNTYIHAPTELMEFAKAEGTMSFVCESCGFEQHMILVDGSWK